MVKKTSKSRRRPIDDPSERDHLGLERLLFFSDAVFAIAITLLVLEVRLPASEERMTNGQLLQSLLSLWPKYLSYAVSFLVIGFFWIGHHRKFRFIQRYDSSLLQLNILLLMGIAFIPFPTAILSEYGNRTATIFYALTITITGLLNAAVWVYAAHHHRLIDPGFSPQQIRRETLRALAVPGVYLFSIGLAFLDASATVAKFSWMLILVALRLTQE